MAVYRSKEAAGIDFDADAKRAVAATAAATAANLVQPQEDMGADEGMLPGVESGAASGAAAGSGDGGGHSGSVRVSGTALKAIQLARLPPTPPSRLAQWELDRQADLAYEARSPVGSGLPHVGQTAQTSDRGQTGARRAAGDDRMSTTALPPAAATFSHEQQAGAKPTERAAAESAAATAHEAAHEAVTAAAEAVVASDARLGGAWEDANLQAATSASAAAAAQAAALAADTAAEAVVDRATETLDHPNPNPNPNPDPEEMEITPPAGVSVGDASVGDASVGDASGDVSAEAVAETRGEGSFNAAADNVGDPPAGHVADVPVAATAEPETAEDDVDGGPESPPPEETAEVPGSTPDEQDESEGESA